MAGLIVGIVALPLAIAFGIASGVSPEKGLYTAIIAGFIISAMGGSRVQIGGPTGAFIVIVYGIVQHYIVGGLTIATFMAGIMLVLMGLARFGAVIKFIPHPLITGFTSGIALIVFSSEVKRFLWASDGRGPGRLLGEVEGVRRAFTDLEPLCCGKIAAATVAIVLLWVRRSRKRSRGSMVAILIAIAVPVHWLKLPVETIGSRYGECRIRSCLPRQCPGWILRRSGGWCSRAFS